MQLPYGKLATSRRGPAELKELAEAIAQASLSGYLRVSVFERSVVHECVIVYAAGRPVMAFVSDGTADRRDPDCRQTSEAIRKDNAIVEVCQLQDKQVKLLQDLYHDFAIAPALATAPLQQAPKEPPAAAAAPRRQEKARPAQAPEIRGRFVRAESLGGIDEYLRRHPGETGHLLYIAQLNGRPEEHHVILIKGNIETVYNDRTSGPELLEQLKYASGQAEFYTVDEALLTSIVGRRARATSPPPARRQAPELLTLERQTSELLALERQTSERLAPERQTSGIGIPARDLLESAWPALSPRDSIARAIGEISGGMEDDIAMMRRVEREFASHVDELLSKLELSHLRSRKRI